MGKGIKKVCIRQVRSVIGRPRRQRATMWALGLRKRGRSVEQVLTPPIAGMLSKVSHLVEVVEVRES